ncbi:probable deoxycytidylate deaminase [Amblyraja radiata]|uniref:probable deoxycytidylate deaminase n=1 Tax=Amblyraja radiata TaxID=386614 RepID=UPI0014025482|nr:probable deoxycytidylate deaminase [Amblyraja radiata]
MVAPLDGHTPCLLFEYTYLHLLPGYIRLQLTDVSFADIRALGRCADALWMARPDDINALAVSSHGDALRTTRPDDVNALAFSRHCYAELNAILDKKASDVKGCTMYVALFPCNECAKLIIQSGITKVVYMSDKYRELPKMEASRRMLGMAGVKCSQFTPKNKTITIDFDAINKSGSCLDSSKVAAPASLSSC